MFTWNRRWNRWSFLISVPSFCCSTRNIPFVFIIFTNILAASVDYFSSNNWTRSYFYSLCHITWKVKSFYVKKFKFKTQIWVQLLFFDLPSSREGNKRPHPTRSWFPRAKLAWLANFLFGNIFRIFLKNNSHLFCVTFSSNQHAKCDKYYTSRY